MEDFCEASSHFVFVEKNVEKLILFFNGIFEIIFSPFEFQLVVTSRSRPCNRCHGRFRLTSWQTQTGDHGCGYHGENSKDRWHGYTGWKVVNHKRVLQNFRVKTA